MSRLAILLWVLCAFSSAPVVAQGKPASDKFWTKSADNFGAADWLVYRPKEEKLQKQGFMVYHMSPPQTEPPVVREILGELYGQVQDLRILGQKKVPWRDGEATLVSFSGESEDQTTVGRVIIYASADHTEILMLIRHPEADKSLVDNFERVRANWPSWLEAHK